MDNDKKRYGIHMDHAAVGGLDVRRLRTLARIIAALDFNCVRLPYSLDVIYDKIEVAEPRKTL
jgi:hypothetical protein